MTIIFNYIHYEWDEYLNRSQCDFSKRTGTREAFLGLILTAEIYLELKKTCTSALLTIKKLLIAETTWSIQILEQIDLDRRGITIISKTYWKYKGCIPTTSGNSEVVILKNKWRDDQQHKVCRQYRHHSRNWRTTTN